VTQVALAFLLRKGFVSLDKYVGSHRSGKSWSHEGTMWLFPKAVLPPLAQKSRGNQQLASGRFTRARQKDLSR
jgi:hypothetical protein